MSIFKNSTENDILIPKKYKGVIYTRVSDTRQVDGYSLEVQEKQCLALAEANEIDIVRVYRDEGVSGKTLYREEFQKMISFIMENVNEIDYIIFYQLTRISRRLMDILELVELLDDLGIVFLSHKDGINNNAYGKFTLQLLGSLAELEIGQLRERVIPSMRARAEEGKRNGGRYTPYGYRYEEKLNKDKKMEKVLVINEDEAKQIRFIYDLYTSNITIDDKIGVSIIYKALEENGFKYRKSKKGKEQNWTTKRISSVLSDSNASLYNGYIEWGRYSLKPKKKKNENGKLEVVLNSKRKPVMERKENDNWIIAKGQHEPIITPEMYELYKQRKAIANKPTKTNKGRNAVYHLTSILRCQDCGGVMDATKEAHGLVYKCRLATSQPGKCHSNTIKFDYIKEDVETIFFSYLKLMFFSNIPKVVLSEVISNFRVTNAGNKIMNIKAEMEQLEQLAIRDKIEFNKINEPSNFEKNVYTRTYNERKDRYNKLEAELNELNLKNNYIQYNDTVIKRIFDYIDNINDLENYYYNLSNDLQIDLYRKLFNKIIVRKEKFGKNGKAVQGKKTITGIEFYINFDSINFFNLEEVKGIYKNQNIINQSEQVLKLIDNENYINLFNTLITELNVLKQNVKLKIEDKYYNSKQVLTIAQMIINYDDIKFDDSVLDTLEIPDIKEIEYNHELDKLINELTKKEAD